MRKTLDIQEKKRRGRPHLTWRATVEKDIKKRQSRTEDLGDL